MIIIKNIKMKNQKYLFWIILLFIIVFQSCEDSEVVETPNFTISYDMQAKAGEPVEFSIVNSPQF